MDSFRIRCGLFQDFWALSNPGHGIVRTTISLSGTLSAISCHLDHLSGFIVDSFWDSFCDFVPSGSSFWIRCGLFQDFWASASIPRLAGLLVFRFFVFCCLLCLPTLGYHCFFASYFAFHFADFVSEARCMQSNKEQSKGAIPQQKTTRFRN